MSTRRERQARRRKVAEVKRNAAEFDVYFDEHGRIACAKVGRGEVEYVRLLRGASLIVEECEAGAFLDDYKKQEDYPADKAALMLANYAKVIGSSAAALEFLGIEDSELIKEAVDKYCSPTEEALKTKPRKKAEPKETNTRSVEWGGEKYSSMADMIRKMLTAGEDDDTIFEAMKGAYNAPNSKRNYIDYYRKQLEKDDGSKREKTRRKRVRQNSTKNRRSRKKSA